MISRDVPGKDSESFDLILKSAWFKQDDILRSGGSLIKVETGPTRKWHHKLLQVLSFGLYKAPFYYTVKPHKL